MKQELISKSKFISLVLRHKPETIGLMLDEQGWAIVDELIEKTNGHSKGMFLNKDILDEIVSTNEKKRFSYNKDKTKIRAVQGHSIDVDLQLQPVEPPNTLWHGTSESSWDSISKSGLDKMGRQYVHLSYNPDMAKKVGSRHGDLLVLVINSGQMYNDGYKFYQAVNGVWLTDSVPVEYIERLF